LSIGKEKRNPKRKRETMTVHRDRISWLTGFEAQWYDYVELHITVPLRLKPLNETWAHRWIIGARSAARA